MDQPRIKRIISLLLNLILVVILLGQYNSLTFAQENQSLPPIKIVHLGDSYSAGNGALSESGDINYYGVEGCYRSPTNWGSQFVETLKDTYSVTYINHACSGGFVSDIVSSKDMDDDDLKNIDGSCPSPLYPDEEFYVDDSLLTCSRWLNPQIDYIDESVDLVLMTMGGNDLGFERIVRNCFSPLKTPDSCRLAVEAATNDTAMDTLKERLISSFIAIRAKLKPEAKIAYISYPHISLNEQYLIKFGDDVYDAGTEIRSLSLKGEELQKEAVEEANSLAGEEYIVFYNETKELFDGHEPDPALFEINPDRWINEFEGPKNMWYHPNPLGHENWANALSNFETFGAVGGYLETNVDIDVAFVVDTTGSMGGEISQVRTDLSILVNQLSETTDSYRVAVVSYRDFPERTGWLGDYPYKVNLTFTDDLSSIQTAIDSLIAQGGGDWPETVFSGIQAAIDLKWRPGVTKIAIVIGDAPALSPEPITNLTTAQIIANSIAVDPVQIIGVNTGSLDANGAVGLIAEGTGGSVILGTTGLTTKISEILDSVVKQPFAWVGQAYSGKIGQTIVFDASGSYDPSGFTITLYEWDFDGDGIFDLETLEPTATHIYNDDYNDFIILRVTGSGGTALASARVVVNEEGFVSQGDENSCELDENGYSIIIDEEGRSIRCTADSLPDDLLEGVIEIFGSSPELIEINDQFIQYSDQLMLDIFAIDPDDSPNLLFYEASGLPLGIELTNNEDGTATISGLVRDELKTYEIEVIVSDPDGNTDTQSFVINVLPEDSRATYTGPMLVSTACTDCSTAVVPLRATIQDITDVLGDPSYDDNPGDINLASASFIDRDSNAVLCSAPVTLFDLADSTIGSVACDWMADIGTQDGYDYNIGIVVDGYYTRNSTADDAIVVISKPSENSITGGGYLLNSSTAGTYAGDVDLRTHFGFNIKFIGNKGRGQDIVGRATILIREDGHVYRIKTNALESLVVVPAKDEIPAVGEFLSKVSIEDVTVPNQPVLLDTKALLNLTMTDYDEASGQYRDLIGISIWSKNGSLLFSSNWTGTQTVEQIIESGNLEIHDFTKLPK